MKKNTLRNSNEPKHKSMLVLETPLEDDSKDERPIGNNELPTADRDTIDATNEVQQDESTANKDENTA